jgi:hypothetical protein
MEPDVLSHVNRNCPPGQTDTTPDGDSVTEVPVITNKIQFTSIIIGVTPGSKTIANHKEAL